MNLKPVPHPDATLIWYVSTFTEEEPPVSFPAVKNVSLALQQLKAEGICRVRLVLDGQGGSADAAVYLYKAIRELRDDHFAVDTHVPGFNPRPPTKYTHRCYSGMVGVYMAGEHRSAGPTSLFQLHDMGKIERDFVDIFRKELKTEHAAAVLAKGAALEWFFKREEAACVGIVNAVLETDDYSGQYVRGKIAFVT